MATAIEHQRRRRRSLFLISACISSAFSRDSSLVLILTLPVLMPVESCFMYQRGLTQHHTMWVYDGSLKSGVQDKKSLDLIFHQISWNFPFWWCSMETREIICYIPLSFFPIERHLSGNPSIGGQRILLQEQTECHGGADGEVSRPPVFSESLWQTVEFYSDSFNRLDFLTGQKSATERLLTFMKKTTQAVHGVLDKDI